MRIVRICRACLGGIGPAWPGLGMGMFLMLIAPFSVAGAESPAMDAVEKAVLAEDWAGIAKDLLAAVNEDAGHSPVLRLVKAHACLALNRNNESLVLFLSLQKGDQLAPCEQWARSLAKGNPNAAVAYYFLGDVQARSKRWKAAVDDYSKGLALRAGHPLLLNARGAALARDDQLRAARADFAAAARDKRMPLADARCNIGMLAIQRKGGAEGALRAFEEALKLSPDFALALYGRGCATLVSPAEAKRGDKEEKPAEGPDERVQRAGEFFRKAFDAAGAAAPLLKEAQVEFLAQTQGVTKEEMVQMLVGKDPGMSLSTSFNRMTDSYNKTGKVDQKLYNNFVSAYRTAPAAAHSLADAQLGKQGMAFQQSFGKAAGAGVTHNEQSYHTLQSWGADASVKVGAKGLGGGAGLKVGFGGFDDVRKGNFQVHSHFQNLAADNITKKGGGLQEVQGVLATLAGAVWDDGDWPFAPLYGLSYQLP